MNALLDVSLLLARGWQSHAQHVAATAWLDAQGEFATCALVSLGFLRVSIGPAYRASFADAMQALKAVISRATARSIPVDFDPVNLPGLFSHADVTDAYLVELARAHGLRLATLDAALCKKSWAANVAFNPLSPATSSPNP